MDEITIDLAKEFSPKPFGRYKTDGSYSGEAFREEFLKPPLRERKKVVVDLSGSNLYGSSFLEEAFGGLLDEFTPQELKTHLMVVHRLLPSIEEEGYFYIAGNE